MGQGHTHAIRVQACVHILVENAGHCGGEPADVHIQHSSIEIKQVLVIREQTTKFVQSTSSSHPQFCFNIFLRPFTTNTIHTTSVASLFETSGIFAHT